MSQQCDLVIQVNGRRTFFLHQTTLSAYSGKLKKIVTGEKKKKQSKTSRFRINDFPGGSDGFELVCRFCYNNGGIKITVSNACLLYCCAVFLEMDEDVRNFNLLKQAENFLQGMFFWPWNHILESLKSCVSFFTIADSCGLIQKLICALLFKISQNSYARPLASSSSCSSSPETTNGMFPSSAKTTPDDSSTNQWWFDDLTTLPPMIISKFVQNFEAYRSTNNCLILTRFLLYYLKSALQCKSQRNLRKGVVHSRSQYSSLADTAVEGVVLVGKNTFSCRGLFSVLRIVSNFSLSKDCRDKLEGVIGGMLDQTTLDDLLVSGNDMCVYDVDLVLRLVRIFVSSKNVSAQRMKKVGSLIDKYLGEISPDQNLKISKFLEVEESLPDSARDCFDGVYRAIDIYLESHPALSFEVRSSLYKCLNYKKLSFEACKDISKNPRTPPNIACQALMSLSSSKTTPKVYVHNEVTTPVDTLSSSQMTSFDGVDQKSPSSGNEDTTLAIKKMERRVKELEKVCREMRGQMSRLAKKKVVSSSSPQYRSLPILCRKSHTCKHSQKKNT